MRPAHNARIIATADLFDWDEIVCVTIKNIKGGQCSVAIIEANEIYASRNQHLTIRSKHVITLTYLKIELPL